MLKTVKELIDFLDRRSRLEICLLTIPMFMVTVLEMMSIALILPVIQVVLMNDNESPAAAFLIGLLPAGLSPDRVAASVAIIFAVAFALKNILLLGLIHLVNRVIYQKTARFANRLYGQYLYRPLLFHTGRDSAEIVRNLITGAGQAFEAIRLLLLSLLEALLMLGAIGVLLFVEPMITVILAGFLLTLGFLFHLGSASAFYRWGKHMMHYEGRLIALINQSLIAIRDVKLFQAYRFFGGRYLDIALSRALFSSRLATSAQIPRLLIETCVVAGFMVFVISLLGLNKASGEVMAILGLYGMAAFRMMPSLNRVLTSMAELQGRTAYVNELHRDLADGEIDTDRQPDAPEGGGGPGGGQIRLQDIVFTYPDTVHHALNGISLTIEKGQSIGLVGSSGAGKTTMVDILLGLLRPRSGQLLIDGEDASANLSDWRRKIGYVPQNFQVVNDTVWRNIAFGVDEKDIDTARVEEIIGMMRLGEHIASLPDGMDTVLGEYGAKLSGGQNQRIAIARALYRDPEILIFDEATSALDNETEHEITSAIQELAGEKTIIVIAHRLSTVKNCSKLVFMKDGQIQAVGTFEELMANDADFNRMAQLGDFNSGSSDGVY